MRGASGSPLPWCFSRATAGRRCRCSSRCERDHNKGCDLRHNHSAFLCSVCNERIRPSRGSVKLYCGRRGVVSRSTKVGVSRGAGAWSRWTAMWMCCGVACGGVDALAPPAQAQTVRVNAYYHPRPYYPRPAYPRYAYPPAGYYAPRAYYPPPASYYYPQPHYPPPPGYQSPQQGYPPPPHYQPPPQAYAAPPSSQAPPSQPPPAQPPQGSPPPQ